MHKNIIGAITAIYLDIYHVYVRMLHNFGPILKNNIREIFWDVIESDMLMNDWRQQNIMWILIEMGWCSPEKTCNKNGIGQFHSYHGQGMLW